MKVVIIGGGIAGLTLGVLLSKKNFEVVINERNEGKPIRGHAFLMHTDGIAILTELAGKTNAIPPGRKITSFNLRRPDGQEVKNMRLQGWQCIKRLDLICFLYSLLPTSVIKEGRTFSHFLYDGSIAVAAVFTNGEVEYGDVFVGADGGYSKVRELLFGKTIYSPVQVKEMVGITSNFKRKTKTPQSEFIKFQNKNNGLAFGLIPISEKEYVWFMQYDPAISDVAQSTPEELSFFCQKVLNKFPSAVREIIDGNDFTTTYIWNTRDFDLLPSFHKGNVVLIGDAAHLALPFTSAGTTNAIVDAKTLVQSLSRFGNVENAFNEYYELRAQEVARHIHLGRELKSMFLNPGNHHEDELPLPLITDGEQNSHAARNKLVQILYFTDPICSTCWIIQPILRKLSLEYGKYINVEYRMGGLLPSWENYNKGRIQQPSDAAKHWEEVCVAHEMPLDGDIWTEDPLPSSYPPSIAFKAAQMQDIYKATLFLRRIKEMVFVEKKNIIKWQHLAKAAFDVGLDSARLLRDFEGKAQDLFRDDLLLARQMGVISFPTLFFRNGFPTQYSLRGYKPYQEFESIIQKLVPNAKKERVETDPVSLFTKFPSMTTKEFAFLSDIPKESAVSSLSKLYQQGYLTKYDGKNGTIWISRTA